MDYFLLVLSGAIAAMLTFVLHDRWQQGIVRASAIVGVAAGLVTLFFPLLISFYFAHYFALVCFGASFVGMVQARVCSSYFLIGLGGAVFTLIFLNASKFVDGFGGGLGAPACIALLIVLALPILWKRVGLKR